MMPSKYIHARYVRLPYSNGEIFHWKTLPQKKLLRMDDQCFMLSQQESRDFQNNFRTGEKPLDHELLWVVSRPGGSVYTPEYVVRFYHRPSAMLFKLSRLTHETQESI